jgi:hypothetical protein
VFLSYARADQAYVEQLAAEASRRGITVWFDSDIESGEQWADVIEDKVRHCVVFVPLVTPASLDSTWCRRELLLADHLGKPLVALVREDIEPPLALVDRQYETFASSRLPTDRWFIALAERLGVSAMQVDDATTMPSEPGFPLPGVDGVARADLEVAIALESFEFGLPPSDFLEAVEQRLGYPDEINAVTRDRMRSGLARALKRRSRLDRKRARALLDQLEHRPDSW